MSTPRRHLARSYQAGRTRIRQLNHARPVPRETAAHPRNPTQANARLPDHFPTNANRGDSPRPPCEPMPIPLKPSAGKHPPQITTRRRPQRGIVNLTPTLEAPSPPPPATLPAP